jgi:hypothetical protein
VTRASSRAVLGSVACAALLGACGDDVRSNGTFAPASSLQIGGEGVQWPVGVATSHGRTVVAALYFDAPFPLGRRQFDAAGGVDALVFSLDDAGNPVWAWPLAGTGDDFIVGVSTTEDGSVLVGGAATAGASFADRPLDVTAESSALVAKLDPDGNPSWLHVAKGTGFQAVTAVAPTADGGAFVAGDFTEDFDLGTGLLTATDQGDGFLARFDAAGAVQWLKVIGGAGDQHVAQLAVGPTGDAFLIGHYRGELALGDAPVPANPAFDYTPFVARFQSDGTFAWVQTNLLPEERDHAAHVAPMKPSSDTEVHHHPGLAVSELSVAVSSGGAVAAGVSFGGSFAHLDQDFEAPRINSLVLTSLSADGELVSQDQLTSPDGSIHLGKVIADGNRTYLSASWNGELAGAVSGRVLASTDHPSLLIVGPADAGGVEPVGLWSLDGAALDSASAALGPNNSLVVAASRTDLSSLDRDIFLARFR